MQTKNSIIAPPKKTSSDYVKPPTRVYNTRARSKIMERSQSEEGQKGEQDMIAMDSRITAMENQMAQMFEMMKIMTTAVSGKSSVDAPVIIGQSQPMIEGDIG